MSPGKGVVRTARAGDGQTDLQQVTPVLPTDTATSGVTHGHQ